MAQRVPVIIATYRCPEMLAACLDRRLGDRSAKDRVVLVVDNGCDDDMAEMIPPTPSGLTGPSVAFLELRSGQAHARNRGVAETRRVAPSKRDI
jgi:GT2 family glycosyltransferase